MVSQSHLSICKKPIEWLFVIDRSAAIGEDSIGAKAVLDNKLVAQTTAWRKIKWFT